MTYSRYGFGSQDAEAPGGVLRWVELPPAEVKFIGEWGGEDHPNHIKVVSLLQYSITVPQTLWYLEKTKRWDN